MRKKYVFAFLFLTLSMPAFADSQSKSLNQLLYDYASPTMKQHMDAEKQAEIKSLQMKEDNAIKVREAEARSVETKIKFCEGMAYQYNKAEGKQGKNPNVYYDYVSGECVTPETSSPIPVLFVAPLGGHW